MTSKKIIEELFEDSNLYVRRRPILIRRNLTYTEIESFLGKRKYDGAFKQETYEDDRYEQNIPTDFFKNNIGHGVVINNDNEQQKSSVNNKEKNEVDINELMQWIEFYRANRHLYQ